MDVATNILIVIDIYNIYATFKGQWNPSYVATPFAPEKLPF